MCSIQDIQEYASEYGYIYRGMLMMDDVMRARWVDADEHDWQLRIPFLDDRQCMYLCVLCWCSRCCMGWLFSTPISTERARYHHDALRIMCNLEEFF